jgi:oligoribonuclease
VLGEGIDVVVKPPPESLEQMDDFVRTMHVSSGLLEELPDGLPLEEAEQQVLAYIKEHCPDGSRPPLAGNTVATDRSFLARDMAELEAFLHYRIVDVSSIKELSRRWFPKAYFGAPAKSGNHRALADIQESIEELRYYRAAVFVAPPGPDSETAKSLAREHGGSITGAGVDAPTADSEAAAPGPAAD